MNNIEIIDYAIKTTMDKGGSFSSENYISSALKQYAELNYSKGFTSNKSSRKYIETLSKDDIDRELLKNIIKKRAYAETNGYNVLLNTNKTINDELTISELELILIKNMDEAPLDVAKYLLDKLTKVRSLLINSFVDSRYFNQSYGADELDNQEMSTYYRTLINKIDDYYNLLAMTKKGLAY